MDALYEDNEDYSLLQNLRCVVHVPRILLKSLTIEQQHDATRTYYLTRKPTKQMVGDYADHV